MTAKEIVNLYYKDFKFRRYQKEAIIFIIDTYMNNKNAKIFLDAPTGAGKSIIALFSSNIIAQHFKNEGYIITSETSLQKQYEIDIEDFGYNIPSIMGLSNYICTTNLDTVNYGDCKLKFLSSVKRQELSCYNFCTYYTARDKASKSPVALLNYNYWLPQVNSEMEEEHKLFTNRDFCFFDEAHRIVRIVNSQFAPKIDKGFLELLEKVLNFFVSKEIYNRGRKNDILNQFINLYNLLKDEEDSYTIFKFVSEFVSIFNSYITSFEAHIKNELEKNKDEITRDFKTCVVQMDKVKSVVNKFQTYLDAIKGNENLILKSVTDDNEVILYCKDESLLTQKYFHGKYGFGVFMSATFLDDDFFKKYIGVSDDVIFLKIPNTFDYTKSHIYYYKDFNMSYGKKHLHIKDQIEEIDNIVEKYNSGIIHTNSFEFVKELLQNSKAVRSKKIKTYSNTLEKQTLIAELKLSKDFFIAGPSLLEGIDLPDDISRCQIFMKVPYLFLGDVFVKYKFNTDKNWYMWNTALNFVQGIGRSIRNKEDYCDTYIMDSSFSNLLRSGMIPQYLIKIIKRV